MDNIFIQFFSRNIDLITVYPYGSSPKGGAVSRHHLVVSTSLLILIFSTFFSIDACAEKFNVGMYGIWARENKEQAFKLLAENGFNIASGVGGMDVLDIAHKYKIQCLVGTDTQLTKDIANDSLYWKKYLEEITQKVRTLKNHPALFAWYFLDEPSWKKIPIRKIKDMNRRIRSIDPKHPIYTVLSTPETWRPYLPLFDIVAIDPYLRADKSTPAGRPEIVKSWKQKINSDIEELSGNKPAVWVVLGAFDSKPKRFFVHPAFRKPQPNEFEKMVALAISEKVDGIMIYSLAFKDSVDYADWYLPSDDPKLWDVVRKTPSKLYRECR